MCRVQSLKGTFEDLEEGQLSWPTVSEKSLQDRVAR